jgi:hypothetical protein
LITALSDDPWLASFASYGSESFLELRMIIIVNRTKPKVDRHFGSVTPVGTCAPDHCQVIEKTRHWVLRGKEGVLEGGRERNEKYIRSAEKSIE